MSENSFLELCDTLRDKYSMTEGDWKTLLEQGRDLYVRLPDRALSYEAVQRVTNDSALCAVDVIRRDLDPLFKLLTKEFHDADRKCEAYAVRCAYRLAMYRIDLLLDDIGTRGNPGPEMLRVAEEATARLAATDPPPASHLHV